MISFLIGMILGIVCGAAALRALLEVPKRVGQYVAKALREDPEIAAQLRAVDKARFKERRHRFDDMAELAGAQDKARARARSRGPEPYDPAAYPPGYGPWYAPRFPVRRVRRLGVDLTLEEMEAEIEAELRRAQKEDV